MSRLAKLVGMVAGAMIAGGGLALADSGQFNKFPDGDIGFFIGTAGDARGINFPGANAPQAVCGDAPTSAPQQFNSNLQQDLSFRPDPVLASIRPSYFQPRVCSGSVFTGGADQFYLQLNWAAASGATPGGENGVTKHQP